MKHILLPFSHIQRNNSSKVLDFGRQNKMFLALFSDIISNLIILYLCLFVTERKRFILQVNILRQLQQSGQQ
jgi:hypothetical protein